MHRRRFLELATGSLVMGGCIESFPGDDGRDSSSSGESTLTPLSGDGRVRWQVPIGKRAPVPAVDDGSVYAVETTSGIHAFNADDGRRRWHRSGPQSAWFGPAVDDGVVFAVGHHTLVAYDADSGDQQWGYTWRDTAFMEAAPVVGESAVFVGISSTPTSHTGSAFPEDLWAFDRRDGSVLWNRDLGESEDRSSNSALSGRPILHDGTLYVLTRSGTVSALDPSDGSERWRRELDGISQTGGPALVAEQETLVVRTETQSDGGLVALGTDGGRERWRVEGIQTAPVSQGTTVYGARNADDGGESTVFAVSAADGNERWQFSRSGRLWRWTSLSVSDGTVFASFTERMGTGNVKDDESSLYAVGTEGTEQWRFTRSCEGFSRAVVSEGTVYVASRLGDGTLYALATGV